MAIQKLFTSLSKAGNTNLYVGEKGRIWYDSVLGFRISDGVTPGGQAAAVAVTNANIGDLVITGATISTVNTNEDLNLDSNGTGNVNIRGAFITATTAGRTTIETLQNGTVNFYVPTIGYDSAIDIIGSADGTQQYPQNTGVLLHLTGQDSLPARIYNDSVNNYAAFIGRRYNGTASAPTQVLSGNIIARLGATPYSSSGWPAISTARVDFVALEDQTGTDRGTSIQFYTTPVGSASSVPSMTVASTGISNAANVVPASDEVYYLGSPTLRWQGVYVGKGGLTMADSTTNVNVPISVNNGTLYLNSVQNIAVGNLVITDTTLTTATSATDIYVGATSDTGNLTIGRSVKIVTQNLNTEAALLINGTLTNIVPTEYTNTLFHTVAVPGYNGIHLSDTFGTDVFSTFEGRHARGNIASPSATQSGDILLRVAGAGYGTNTFDTALGTQGGSRIDFRATENYTNTAKGSDIHFWTTQPGTTSTVNSGSIDWQGFSGNAFTFTTDNTVQTTAGIPLTQKGSGLGVATLDSNGYLTAAQIPPSLTGGVVYKGAWDASTNTPNLANGSGTAGWEYSISTAGTQNLGAGNQAYAQGGFVIYNGSVWSYVPPSGLFTSLTAGTHLSVNQPTGAITVSTDATPNNTATTIVSRDASGNFVANTITATLSGAATTAGTAGTVTNAVQTAITQVGTLTSLGVTGNVTTGNVSAGTGTISAATGQFTNINNSLQTITANVGAFETYANATFATASTVQTLSANVGAFETFSNANTAGLYNSILGANAAIVTANTAMKGYVDAVSTAWTANAGTQQTQINSLATNANANVAAYLTTASINTTGNVTAGNVIATTYYGNIVGTTSTLTGNITAGNLVTTGNTYAGNVIVSGNETITGNVTAANVNATLHGNVVGVASNLGTNTTSFASAFLTGQLSISPGLIAKTSASTQTFTITGLTTSHKIVISPANDLTYGIYITAAYVSATSTVSIQFQNTTPGGVTPATMNINYFAWV